MAQSKYIRSELRILLIILKADLMPLECPPQSPPSPLAGKEFSGSLLSRAQPCLICRCCDKENCPPMLCGSKVNKKPEARMDICIGSSSSPSPRKLLWPPSEESLAEVSMQSFPDLNVRMTTFAKKKPESMDLGSMEQSLSEEMPKLIGKPSGNRPRPGIWRPSPPTYEWSLTGHFERLVPTMTALDRLFAKFGYTGAEVGLVNLGELGKKEAWMLTASVQGASFGMVTRVNRVLSLMNSEEVSTFPMCCDGVIGTRSVWRSKEAQDLLNARRSGLLRM